MQYRLRTLLILLAIGPPAIAWLPGWWQEQYGFFWTAYFAVAWAMIVLGLWGVMKSAA
jgi:hypothetical protein